MEVLEKVVKASTSPYRPYLGLLPAEKSFFSMNWPDLDLKS